jgi:hypothetical protein
LRYIGERILKKFHSLVIGFILLISFFSITNVFAQVSVGVKEGDWIKYGSFSVVSTGPIPTYFQKELNKTDWMLITVQTISATNITYEVDWHFKNGTDSLFTDWIDIIGGVNPDSKLTDPFAFFISSNLPVGAGLYNVATGPFVGWEINETINREYLGIVEETQHTNILSSLIGATHTYNIYWDKGSGVLTEYNYSMTVVYPSSPTIEVHFEIDESNPTWPIPEFPTSMLIPVFMLATLLAVIMYRRKPIIKKEGS